MPKPPAPTPSPLLELQARLEGVRVFLAQEIPEWRRLQALLEATLPPEPGRSERFESGEVTPALAVWVGVDEIVLLTGRLLAQLEASSQASEGDPWPACRSGHALLAEVDPHLQTTEEVVL
jgi:hypothetical protein